MLDDYSDERIQIFLRKAGHRIEWYIKQQIGPYPGSLLSSIEEK